MKKLLISFLLPAGLFLAACSDDQDCGLQLGPQDLAQTTWNGRDVCYEGETPIGTTSFIVEFRTETSGRYIYLDQEGVPSDSNSLTYNIQGQQISFSGAIVGTWTVIERTRSAITLRAFQPKEHRLFLEKI